MSAILNIFDDIISELQDKAPDIQESGLWNNQFDNENAETAFNYPCVFIEYAAIEWPETRQQSGATGNSQLISKEQLSGDVVITLHIGHSKLNDETLSFPEIDEINQKVYFAIQGLQGEFFNPLLRSAERQDTNHGRIIDWQMDFATQLSQCGEIDTTKKLVPQPIDVDVNLELDIDNIVIRTGDGK